MHKSLISAKSSRSLSLHIADEAEQIAFGSRLGRLAGDQGVFFLEGDLGAGKTTLVRGFMRGRGYQGKVKSPTYTLLEPYGLATGNCYHFDLYRLVDPEELVYVGLRDKLAESAIVLIEWPERAYDLLPVPDLGIRIAYHVLTGGREVRLRSYTVIGDRLLGGVLNELSDNGFESFSAEKGQNPVI
jgi:tRNA threonylcarbamoyladenosine biosynthesis protein TsaE